MYNFLFVGEEEMYIIIFNNVACSPITCINGRHRQGIITFLSDKIEYCVYASKTPNILLHLKTKIVYACRDTAQELVLTEAEFDSICICMLGSSWFFDILYDSS